MYTSRKGFTNINVGDNILATAHILSYHTAHLKILELVQGHYNTYINNPYTYMFCKFHYSKVDLYEMLHRIYIRILTLLSTRSSHIIIIALSCSMCFLCKHFISRLTIVSLDHPIYSIVMQHVFYVQAIHIKTHDCESRGQEEAGHT